MRPLPLDSLHRAAGAQMAGFAGFSMPIRYTSGILAEHRHTRTHAGLFDVSHMGQITLRGADNITALQKLVPTDIGRLSNGDVVYSVLTNTKGGVIDDLLLTRRDDTLYLVVNGATREADLAHLKTHLPNPKDMTVHFDSHGLLALQGPRAREVLGALTDGAVDALYFMQGAGFDINGLPMWISRTGYTGEDGFELSCPTEHLETLAGLLLANAAVQWIGLGARDSLRLETGLPLYGHDLDMTTTPVEAGLGFILTNSDAYLGQGIIAAQQKSGAPRRRVGLLPDGAAPIREGVELFNARGEKIGAVTSGGFSPSLEKPIAMGYVTTENAAAGTTITARLRGRDMACTVTKLPFLKPKYVRKN